MAFGAILRTSIDGVKVRPTDVGTAFVAALKGRKSRWPAAGQTANRGPWATGRSVAAFRLQQTRQSGGQFDNIRLLNDARNVKGTPYAGFVDRGIGAGPGRRRANRDAVRRTWTQNFESTIGPMALRMRQERGRA